MEELVFIINKILLGLEVLGSPQAVQWWFAIGIGVIVSFDVVGLILSGYKDFQIEGGKKPYKTPFNEALLHAGWHAGLFLVYMAIILVSIDFILIHIPDFVKILIDWLINFFSDYKFKVDVKQMKITVVHLTSMAIVAFIWWTYSKKIIDNHEENVQKSDPLEGSRGHVKFVFTLAKKRKEFKELRNHAFALTVAVDMLALSAILRVYFNLGTDSFNIQNITQNSMHINFLNLSLTQPFQDIVNIIIFAVVIYFTVLCMAFFAGKFSRKLKSDEPMKEAETIEHSFRNIKNGFKSIFKNGFKNIFKSGSILKNIWDVFISIFTRKRLKYLFLILLRILEPFLVFFVLGNAMSHFFGISGEGIFRKEAFLFSFALSIPLICFNFKKVMVNVIAGSSISLRSAQSIEPSTLEKGELSRAFCKLIKSAKFLYLFSFSLYIFIIIAISSVEREPFNDFVDFLALGIAGLTLVILYFSPSIVEVKMNEWIKTYLPLKQYLSLFGEMVYLFIVCSGYVYYISHGLKWERPEVFFFGIILLGLYLMLSYGLIAWRENRQLKAIPIKKTDVSDVLTALGMLGFTWAVVNFFH